MSEVVYILAAFVLVFFLVAVSMYRKAQRLKFQLRSQSTKYGRISEQFMPFMKDYPYNTQGFRFLGTPVDGVQFDDDKIIFVEFKTSSSVLSPKQKSIRGLVEGRKVFFMEIRIA